MYKKPNPTNFEKLSGWDDKIYSYIVYLYSILI
jgi:hypothetical protein